MLELLPVAELIELTLKAFEAMFKSFIPSKLNGYGAVIELPVKSELPKPKISLIVDCDDKIVLLLEKANVNLPVDLFCVMVGLDGNPTDENSHR